MNDNVHGICLNVACLIFEIVSYKAKTNYFANFVTWNLEFRGNDSYMYKDSRVCKNIYWLKWSPGTSHFPIEFTVLLQLVLCPVAALKSLPVHRP